MRPARPLRRIECSAVTGYYPLDGSHHHVLVCAPRVWPLPLCGPWGVAPRPDCLIGRELRIAITSRKRVFFRRESGVVCLEHPLRTPRATSKVTHHYSSSH